MGIFGMAMRGALGGGLVGGAVGAYNTRPGGNRLENALWGAAGGAIGGGIGMGYGAKAFRRVAPIAKTAKGKAMQGIGRLRSGKEMFGPIQRSNAPINSARDAVNTARAMPGTPATSYADRLAAAKKKAELAEIQGVLNATRGPTIGEVRAAEQSRRAVKQARAFRSRAGNAKGAYKAQRRAAARQAYAERQAGMSLAGERQKIASASWKKPKSYSDLSHDDWRQAMLREAGAAWG